MKIIEIVFKKYQLEIVFEKVNLNHIKIFDFKIVFKMCDIEYDWYDWIKIWLKWLIFNFIKIHDFKLHWN